MMSGNVAAVDEGRGVIGKAAIEGENLEGRRREERLVSSHQRSEAVLGEDVGLHRRRRRAAYMHTYAGGSFSFEVEYNGVYGLGLC